MACPLEVLRASEVEISLFLKIMKYEKHKICALGFISHHGVSLMVIGRSVIQIVCVFDVYLFIAFCLLT